MAHRAFRFIPQNWRNTLDLVSILSTCMWNCWSLTFTIILSFSIQLKFYRFNATPRLRKENSGHIQVMNCQHDLKIALNALTMEIYKSTEIAASLGAPHLLSPTPGQTAKLPLQKVTAHPQTILKCDMQSLTINSDISSSAECKLLQSSSVKLNWQSGAGPWTSQGKLSPKLHCGPHLSS